jgi:hypothetical protein
VFESNQRCVLIINKSVVVGFLAALGERERTKVDEFVDIIVTSIKNGLGPLPKYDKTVWVSLSDEERAKTTDREAARAWADSFVKIEHNGEYGSIEEAVRVLIGPHDVLDHALTELARLTLRTIMKAMIEARGAMS